MHNYIFYILSFAPKKRAVFYITSLPLFLTYSGIQISNLYIVNFFLGLDNNSEEKDTLRMNTIVLNMNIVMLLFIVVYYELAVYIRILLNISVINIVFIVNKPFLTENKIIPKLLFTGYLLFWFFAFIFLVKNSTLIPLFSKNLLFR
jgi:hypothetical protein